MLANLLRRTSRAALIAYGGWGLLTLMLVAGTLTSLSQAERAGTQAVLARAEAGASAVEQTVLRVFGAAQTLQSLAQSRVRLIDSGDVAGVQAIDEQLHDDMADGQQGIEAVNIYRHGRLDWSSDPGGWPGAMLAPTQRRAIRR